MKKKRQIWMRGIAVLLAVVVAATTVLHNDEKLFARETFSGLQTMLANNQQLTIVEIVDDFEESSMGYLIGGMEPYNVEQAKRDGTMDDLVDELLTKGLLTTGDTDDWNSYPLRYEVIDTVYSDYADDADILKNADYRQQGEEAAKLSGYYLPIEISGDERAFYRCSKDDYKKMQTMTPSQLRKAAETISGSYAPNNGYPDGYSANDPDFASSQYFQFVVGDPKDAAASVRSVSAGSGAGAVTAGGAVTGAAMQEDAAPTEPEQPSDENAVPTESEQPSDENTVPTESEQPADGDAVPTDTVQPDNVNTVPSDESMASSGGNVTQQDNNSANSAGTPPSGDHADTMSPGSGAAASDNNAAQPESATPAVQPSNENEGAEGTDSASAVIYVEFDEHHTVLLASLGSAGVGDVLDAAQKSDDGTGTVTAPTQSSAATGIGNGAIPTVTPGAAAPAPAPTPGTTSPGAQENDGNGGDSAGGSTSAASPSGTTTPDGSSNTEDSGNTATPTPDDDSDKKDSENESDGSGEEKNDGDDTDGDDIDDDDDGNTDDDDEQDRSDEENSDGEGEEQKEYQVTYRWDGLDSGKGNFTEPSLPTDESVAADGEITIPDAPDAIKVSDSSGEEIGVYTFDGWRIEAAGSDTYTSVSAGDSISVTEDMTVIGAWSYQEGACYTVTYQWVLKEEQEGSLPAGVTADNIVLKSQIQTFDMSSQPEITLPPEESVAEGTSYVVNDDYTAGDVYDVYDTDGNYIGICTFGGWKNGDGISCEGEISLDGDIMLFGELSFRAAGEITYRFDFPWGSNGGLTDDGKALGEKTELSGVGSGEEAKPVRLFLKDGAGLDRAIELPDPQSISGNGCYVNGSYQEGTEIIVREKRTINNGEVSIPIGKLVFSGWKENPSDAEPIDPNSLYSPADSVELVGTWEFISDYSVSCAVNYEWGLLVVNEDDGTSESKSYTFPGTAAGETLELPAGTELPNGVILSDKGYLERNPKMPTEEYGWYQGMNYVPDSEYAEGMKLSLYETVDSVDELVASYTFLGWEIRVDGDETRMLTAAELQSGFQLKGDTTLRGVWKYQPEATADLIVGSGFAYVYINDDIHNNDWFRYYVMGLEEKDFGKVNVRVVTYLADGSDKRAYGYKAQEDCPTLTEAIKKADLVYLNTNGLWMDDDGNTQASDRRLSTENAKALLARACDVERSARLAVILDNSVQSNQVDENVQKVTAVLCQEDVAEAYASLSEDGMSYEKPFSSNEWQRLNALAVIRNGGNFVHDNIYCVSHLRGEFNNSTYPGGESVVRPGSMPALANADFENRFTDQVTDAGFAEVYQAIQKENYERARNGVQASLDEYVIPATAVAYILNYRDYDPIIYKDQIRVLELEPCRDYTYYYDGQSGTTELELKKKFALDWAQDFLAKLDADPNAITIDGMTTSEFCGKILDIYEEYDVIYFGANDGILKMTNETAGFKWVKVDAYEGTILADSAYKPFPWSDERYTYHDGNWYLAVKTGEKKRVETAAPGWEVWGGYYENANWRWNGSENRWEISSNDTGWSWVPASGRYPYEVTSGSYVYDGSNGKWYEEREVYGDGELVPGGPGGGGAEHWFNNGNAGNSNWMWKATPWGETITNGVSDQQLVSQGWYKKEYVEAVTYVSYNDHAMNGMLYTHVGDTMATYMDYYYGLLADGGDAAYGFRTSGNDILKTQVEELENYLKGGSLIILSEKFMTTDGNDKQVINSSHISHKVGEQSYYGILDTSSYLYQFIADSFEKDEAGNDVPRYSNLIVEDYGNGDLRDTEAFVEALNQQKVVLNLYAAPEAYGYLEEGEIGTIGERSLLQKESDGKYYLNYEFIIGNLSAVAPLTTRYDVQLFLDSNSDGIYNMETEELSDVTVINAQTGSVMERSGGAYQLQANIPYRVRRELPDGYVGCIGWKLMVSQNGNEHIHDSVTGLTAVPVQPGYSDEIDPVTGKKIIHVLQIVPGGLTIDLESLTEAAWLKDGEWNQLLSCLPDFKVDFDSIEYTDFAKCWTAGYNGGVDGVLATATRNDYLNLYIYDMIVVGFVDNYPSIPSQEAIDAILRYADTGKSVLFTHDTTFSGWESQPDDFTYSGQHGQPFSMSIRELCGMDRYGVSVDWYETDIDGVKHSNVGGSPLRAAGAATIPYNAASSVSQWWELDSHDGNHTRDVAFAPNTDQSVMTAQTQGMTWTMVNGVYDEMFDWASRGASKPAQSHWLQDYEGQKCEVSQVNAGIITQYPYDIPEVMKVAFTHAQYYQLDLETDRDGDGRGDVVCWYAIKSRTDGDWNDAYDFSPNDVRNNYYIYNKGNITYSGVGHTSDPNALTTDEKKLFINTFIAAYNAGIRNPSVRIVEDGSVNAPDLENVSIPFNGVDETTAGTYRVYYQVKDNNITQGTRNLSVKYYIGNPAGSDTVTYRTETGSQTIPADLFADGALTTYSADTGLPVGYDEVRSGYSYYVDVPLNRLLDNEKFDFYVEVDLTMADDPGRVAAFDVDKLTIAKLKMFSLD